MPRAESLERLLRNFVSWRYFEVRSLEQNFNIIGLEMWS